MLHEYKKIGKKGKKVLVSAQLAAGLVRLGYAKYIESEEMLEKPTPTLSVKKRPPKKMINGITKL